MVNVTCSKCNHEWNYKGDSKIMATCPSCLCKTRINGESEGIED